MFVVDGIYIMLVLPVLMAFVRIELTWGVLGIADFVIGELGCMLGLEYFSS